MIFVVLGAPQGSPVNIPTSGIPIFILVNALQPRKASLPILVTDGSVILVNALQL